MSRGRLSLGATRVLKFGGTSVATPRELRQVARIIRQSWSRGPTVVVVSAIRGVTDALHRVLDEVALRLEDRSRAEARVSGLLDGLRERHLVGLDSWLSEDLIRLLSMRLDLELARLREALSPEDGSMVGGSSLTHDVLAAGERLSVARLSICLRQEGLQPCEFDGVEVLRRSRDGAAHLERIEPGLDALHRWAASPGGVPVVTGFIASDSEGDTVTLGRGASDLSATALASLLGAEEVEIWTDTVGILSADPKWVPDARTLPHLHPGEATALARYGARVLHPEALAPLVGSATAIRILSTLEPAAAGTEIGATAKTALPEQTSELAKSIAFRELDPKDPPAGDQSIVGVPLALAVLTDRGEPQAVLRFVERLLQDFGRSPVESRIEPAGPSHLIVAVVAISTPHEMGELLRYLHQGLCRTSLGTASVRWGEGRLVVASSRERMAC